MARVEVRPASAPMHYPVSGFSFARRRSLANIVGTAK
jgi:hypothetical protein